MNTKSFWPILTAALCVSIAFAALEPSAITYSVNFAGTPSPSDVRTARYVVAQENTRRASLQPPAAALPTGTAADLKSSYLIALARIVTNYAIDSAALADSESFSKLEAYQVRDIQRAVTDKLNDGKTAAQIEAAIKAIP